VDDHWGLWILVMVFYVVALAVMVMVHQRSIISLDEMYGVDFWRHSAASISGGKTDFTSQRYVSTFWRQTSSITQISHTRHQESSSIKKQP
jgi:hypothetical protein